MPRVVILEDGQRLDFLDLGLKAAVLGVSTFTFTLAGMSLAQMDANLLAALWAGGMSAAVRVSAYLLARLNLNGAAPPPPPSPPPAGPEG